MRTLQPRCLQREWIQRKAVEMQPVDPVQLERCLLAFELLGRLADARISFVFKGGTAVLLRLGQFRRLSVDVDIACSWEKKRLEEELEAIGHRAPFHGCEERERRSPPLPKKRHYSFSYRSVISGEKGETILDVLDEENLYPAIGEVPVQMPFFVADHRILVAVPTTEGLLGDKLTAFAPTTVGVEYDPNSPVDVIKQLFDVGHLFDAVSDLKAVSDSYRRVFAAENGYRKGRFTLNQALDDTWEASRLLSAHDLAKGEGSAQARLLADGVRRIGSLLVDARFGLPEAKVAAAKAALLSRILQNSQPRVDVRRLRYDPASIRELEKATIAPPFEYLNNLKGGNPEAFHYWNQALALGAAIPRKPRHP